MLSAVTGAISGRLMPIAIGLTCAVVVGLWFRLDYVSKERDAERAGKLVAVAANEANAQTIAALQERISRDAELLRELRGIRAEITEAADDRRATLDAIAESDDEAAAFLDMPIPDSLRNAQGGNASGGDPGRSE